MKFISLQANRDSFHPVQFKPSFNVIVADRTREAETTDTRNALGKTTIIEILHHLLGARLGDQRLTSPALEGWSFSGEIELDGRQLTINRSLERGARLAITGDISNLLDDQLALSGGASLGVTEWSRLLGRACFGLEGDLEPYAPTFRALISYSIRASLDAFNDPFVTFRQQKTWQRQVYNAYLLGLDWHQASRLQELRDREAVLITLARHTPRGQGMPSVGELEAELIALEERGDQLRDQIRAFTVLAEYRETEQQANGLTRQMQDIGNEITFSERLLELYRRNLQDEVAPLDGEITSSLAEVGLVLGDAAKRSLREVAQFHLQVAANRREYLAAEVARLETRVRDGGVTLESLDRQRSGLLSLLGTSGALEDFLQLQARLSANEALAISIRERIQTARDLQSGRAALEAERGSLRNATIRDVSERRQLWAQVVRRFAANSEALYSRPGRLVIDVLQTGYNFRAEVPGEGSHGVSNMTIFCYDLALAQTWASRSPSPGLLVHDSAIFDGVDERQRARALELAAAASERSGFQYICTMNSDQIPYNDFSPGFDFDGYRCLTLTDSEPSGSLMGFRF